MYISFICTHFFTLLAKRDVFYSVKVIAKLL